MDVTQKIQHLEDELKVLKNEVHQTLLDIKDSLSNGVQVVAPSAQVNPARPAESPQSAFKVAVDEPGMRVQQQGQATTGTPQAASASGTPGGVVGGGAPGAAGSQQWMGQTPVAGQQQQPDQPWARQRQQEPNEMEEESDMQQPEMMPDEQEVGPSFVEYRFGTPEQPPKKGNGHGDKVNSARVGVRARADGRIDLATLATLGNWADRSARKVGRERVEAILDVYQLTGYLPKDMKDVLLRLISLDNAPVDKEQVSLRDCITVLLELNGIVIGHSKTEAAMLSLLINEK